MRKILYTCIAVVFIVVVIVFVPKMKASFVPHVFSSYKTAEYLIDGKPVVLGTNGTQYFGDEVFGDINGDGTPDVAFLFTDEPGGSGTFYYVAAAVKKGDAYTGTNAVFLGDRIAPQTIGMSNGLVAVNYAVRGDYEPMTSAPSIGTTKYLQFVNGTLAEVKP